MRGGEQWKESVVVTGRKQREDEFRLHPVLLIKFVKEKNLRINFCYLYLLIQFIN